MHRAKPKNPMILAHYWKNFELCVVLNASVRRRNAEQPSKRLLNLQYLLVHLLMVPSIVLEPFIQLRVQPAQAQTSGEVVLQCPLRRQQDHL